MSPHEPQKAFVESYIKLLPDTDVSDFQKILDMKGLKRSDQSTMTEIYRSMKPPVPRANGSSDRPAAGPAANESGEYESRIRKLEKLIKRH